jgi:hypothetical protein
MSVISFEFGVSSLEFGVWSFKFGVWSLEFQVRVSSFKCEFQVRVSSSVREFRFSIYPEGVGESQPRVAATLGSVATQCNHNPERVGEPDVKNLANSFRVRCARGVFDPRVEATLG